MIRAALAALATVCLAGAAIASEPARPLVESEPPATIGSEPWLGILGTAAVGAEDAFVFGDAARAGAVDPDAIEAAVRGDRERMARRADAQAMAADDAQGRVAAAYERFVAVGPGGAAYASRAFARGDAGAAEQIARAPLMTPSIVAMILPTD